MARLLVQAWQEHRVNERHTPRVTLCALPSFVRAAIRPTLRFPEPRLSAFTKTQLPCQGSSQLLGAMITLTHSRPGCQCSLGTGDYVPDSPQKTGILAGTGEQQFTEI